MRLPHDTLPVSSIYNILRGLGVDDINEGGLKGGTTDEETVNVLLLGELVAVLLADTATVDDSGVVRSGLADLLSEVLTDGGVDLLSLLSGGDLAGADGPDGLVGNDNLAPVLDLLGDSAELVGNDIDGLVGLSLLKGLANAENDTESVVEGGLGLGGDEVVGLLEDDTALRVTSQGPGNVGLLELAGRDLTSEGTVGLVEDVLGGNLEAGAEVLTGEEKVEGRRGNDDLYELLALAPVRMLCNVYIPTLESTLAWFRLLTMPLIVSTEPFILKLPPTKNWRPMFAVLCGEVVFEKVCMVLEL